jgi:hypothetical protein
MMEHDAFNDRAMITKDLNESNIEPCPDDAGAEAEDETGEVEDAEKEDLLSDKGAKYQFNDF